MLIPMSVTDQANTLIFMSLVVSWSNRYYGDNACLAELSGDVLILGDPNSQTQKTALFELHVALGAKMVPFAGYQMPLNYPTGIIKEHQHTRSNASLFDVSHMGQIHVHGDEAQSALESILPLDLSGVASGKQRYTFLTNAEGGIIDDLIIARSENSWRLVVNAANKFADLEVITAACSGKALVEHLHDEALIALQGPGAAKVLSTIAPATDALSFMSHAMLKIDGIDCGVARSGYTGEDGFEISVPNKHAGRVVRLLMDQPKVAPAGLGCRDSLRLEAGLCLHGNDIDATTTPVEAGLSWAIPAGRRALGRKQGGFPGADVILAEFEHPPARCRVGLRPDGQIPVRPPSAIWDSEDNQCGLVTSGGYGPTVEGPIAMGYVDRAVARTGSKLYAKRRDKMIALTVVKLPFVRHNYRRN